MHEHENKFNNLIFSYYCNILNTPQLIHIYKYITFSLSYDIRKMKISFKETKQ